MLASDCSTQAPDTGSASFPSVVGYPLPPPPQVMPAQEPGALRRPSGLCNAADKSGRPTGSNPLGLPGAGSCANIRRFVFIVKRPHGRRVLRLDVYVNKRHVKTLRAHHGGSVRRVVLTNLPRGHFTLRVVAHTSNHHRIVTLRDYHGCTKGPPHTLHHRKPKPKPKPAAR